MLSVLIYFSTELAKQARAFKPVDLRADETIKEIHIYNPKKSITATVFLVIGGGWGIAILGAFIAYIVSLSNFEGN